MIYLEAPREPIPNLWLSLKELYGRKEFQIKAVPDSGAMMSMISLHILQCHKVTLNISNVGYNVKDVQQNGVLHQGQIDFQVSSYGIKTTIWIVASDNIGDNMLISYQDLLKFQIIPINFLYKVLTYAVSTDVLESIKHDFSDVLNDRLNPTPMKTDKPKHISLKDNAKPLNVLTFRRVPTWYEEQSERAIEDLIQKGVLQKVSEVTDWCSPGFFVTKSYGRVRLLTDFTHLIYISSSIHRPPCTCFPFNKGHSAIHSPWRSLLPEDGRHPWIFPVSSFRRNLISDHVSPAP